MVADLIIHLVDLSSPEYEAHMETTQNVLHELGAAENPVLTVFNKIDRVENELEKLNARRISPGSIFISAQTSKGIPQLLDKLEEIFSSKNKENYYRIPLGRYDLVAKLKAQGNLLEEETTNEGFLVRGYPHGELVRALENFRKKGKINPVAVAFFDSQQESP